MDFSAIKQNLENHGFIVSCFQSAIAATKYLDGVIDGKTIGIGGSKTVEQMGLLQALETHNRVLYRFGTYKSPEEVMKEALTSDVFITSANGVAETGEIVNIDGNCNRIAAEFYGHERVYIIVGSNKIQPPSRRRCGERETSLRQKTQRGLAKTLRVLSTATDATIVLAPNVFAGGLQ